MVLFGLFGDSYIKRLDIFCNGDLHVPGSFTFVYRGGLRLDTLGNEMKMKMKAAKPDTLFLSIGGNDISPVSDPNEIFKGICQLVQDFENAGVRHVYISEILQRADFSKSQPPGLTKSKFNRDRKEINKMLYQKYGDSVIKFHDIHCPRDYLEDLVHLSIPTVTKKTCGIQKYFHRIRLVFCRS